MTSSGNLYGNDYTFYIFVATNVFYSSYLGVLLHRATPINRRYSPDERILRHTRLQRARVNHPIREQEIHQRINNLSHRSDYLRTIDRPVAPQLQPNLLC